MEPTIFKPRLKFKPPLKFFKFHLWTLWLRYNLNVKREGNRIFHSSPWFKPSILLYTILGLNHQSFSILSLVSTIYPSLNYPWFKPSILLCTILGLNHQSFSILSLVWTIYPSLNYPWFKPSILLYTILGFNHQSFSILSLVSTINPSLSYPWFKPSILLYTILGFNHQSFSKLSLVLISLSLSKLSKLYWEDKTLEV